MLKSQKFKYLRWMVTDVNMNIIRTFPTLFNQIRKVFKVSDCHLKCSTNSRETRIIELKVESEVSVASNFKVLVFYLSLFCSYRYIYYMHLSLFNLVGYIIKNQRKNQECRDSTGRDKSKPPCAVQGPKQLSYVCKLFFIVYNFFILCKLFLLY